MLALCWCSLDEGREVVMVMKMTMTTAVTCLTQHGLWSHTCLFIDVLFEVPGTALSLDSTKIWFLYVVFLPTTLLAHYQFRTSK